MAINFGLAERPSNNFMALFEAGQNAARQRVMQQREDQAYARSEQQRQQIAGAYDVTTGRVDQAAVRNAYLQAGDIKGYQDYSKSLQGDQAEAAKLIGQLALYADTPQKWDEAIDWAASRGARELLQYKGQFSEQNRMTALALGGQYDTYRQQNDPKWVTPGEGGAFNARDPRSVEGWLRSQGAPASPPATGGGGSLEEKAQAAIAAGADPALVRSRLAQLKGGAPSQGGGTFRPVSNGADIVKRVIPSAYVTDSRRDPNSALGRANPRSWHVRSGAAVDVRPVPGMSFGDFTSRLRAAGNDIIEARDEVKNPSGHATGPHWHVVLGRR